MCDVLMSRRLGDSSEAVWKEYGHWNQMNLKSSPCSTSYYYVALKGHLISPSFYLSVWKIGPFTYFTDYRKGINILGKESVQGKCSTNDPLLYNEKVIKVIDSPNQMLHIYL